MIYNQNEVSYVNFNFICILKNPNNYIITITDLILSLDNADTFVSILGCDSVYTADTDLLKMVPVEIWLNFGKYFRTLQLGF